MKKESTLNYLDETFRKSEWIKNRRNELPLEEFLAKSNIIAERVIHLFDNKEPVSKRYAIVLSRACNFIDIKKKEEMLLYFWGLAQEITDIKEQDLYASILGMIVQSKDMFFNDYKKQLNINVYYMDKEKYSYDMWLFLSWMSLHKKF